MEQVDDFPSGFFFIRCKAKQMALDVHGGSMVNDSNIIIWPQKLVDSINQLWMHEEGFLINKKSGLVIDIRGGIERDKLIIQYARKPGLATNQRWKYQDGFIFPAASPNLVLDIKNGEYKNGNNVFLNAKSLSSQSQQFIIQPFENEKSKAELALLRPSPLQRSSTFPRNDELYDCYRKVYLEPGTSVTADELAGAAVFKGIKDYVDQARLSSPMIVANDESRSQVIELAKKEVIRVLTEKQVGSNDLVHQALNAAESYFSREYEAD
ncbi:carbohydrate-binding module family 13 protein [Backusella circina FSU 941]|nr:carbohydrate-binding module family 13 protein [Backusella circina FSU 941]